MGEFMYKEQIETKDLVLKKASMDAVNDMYNNIWSQEESAKYMLWVPTKNIHEAQDRMVRTIEFQRDKIAYLDMKKRVDKRLGLLE